MRKNRSSSALPSSRRGYAAMRECRVVSRSVIGEVKYDGSGNISAIGAFTPGTTSPYLIMPANMGWVADLAAHFAQWRLRKCRFVHSAVRQLVDPAFGGTQTFGVIDDPARTITPGSNLYELRSARQVRGDRDWTLDYVPTGPQAVWLESSRNSGTGTSITRQTAAGVLEAASSFATSEVSSTLGILSIEFDIEFRGACCYASPTLSAPLATEEKKEVPASGVKATPKAQSLEGDFELVAIPFRRSGAGAGASVVSAQSIPGSSRS